MAICAAVAVFGYLFWPTFFPQLLPQTTEAARVMSVEDYIKLNISSLSPVTPSLGGMFYVTKIEAHGGAGTVVYEDGHQAYIADFTYNTDENTGIKITAFAVR